MKVKTNKLSGVALIWAMATYEGDDVAVLVNDGVPEVWLNRDVLPGVTRKNHKGEDRFLLGGLWPVGAKCMGRPVDYDNSLVGDIIQRERIQVTPQIGGPHKGEWSANKWHEDKSGAMMPGTQFGPDPITAVMRCCVAMKFGNEIDIPDSLAGAMK